MSFAIARHLHAVQSAPMNDDISGFEPWMRANGCAPNTVQDRLQHVADFTRHHPAFPHVKPMQITMWLGRPGYAPWTRATYYGHLRSFFTFAMENDLLAVDPMARMRRPKPPRGVPRPLTHEQVKLLLLTASPNLRTRLLLGLFAGLRAHEIAQVRGSDIDQGSIYVLGKGGVGASIPTHPLIWAEALSRPRVDWWFPSNTTLGHVASLSVSTGASVHFTACGIEGSIHRTRHTFATELLRAGINVRVVQELMRHRSLASTMVYCAVDERERQVAINALSVAA